MLQVSSKALDGDPHLAGFGLFGLRQWLRVPQPRRMGPGI
jgi:hypothetical protein